MIASAVLPGGVLLRPLNSGDAPALLDAYVRNREHLRPFDPERPDSFWTLDGQRRRLDSLMQQKEEGTLLACAMQRDDLVVGYASLNTIAFGPLCSANLGYWVDVAEVGRGLASAAVGALCRFADRDLGLHRASKHESGERCLAAGVDEKRVRAVRDGTQLLVYRRQMAGQPPLRAHSQRSATDLSLS